MKNERLSIRFNLRLTETSRNQLTTLQEKISVNDSKIVRKLIDLAVTSKEIQEYLKHE